MRAVTSDRALVRRGRAVASKCEGEGVRVRSGSLYVVNGEQFRESVWSHSSGTLDAMT